MFSWSSSLQATFSFLAVLPVIRQVSRYISSVCLVAFPGVVLQAYLVLFVELS